MDLATILAAVVAVLILISSYFLFNGIPSFNRETRQQRPTRRP